MIVDTLNWNMSGVAVVSFARSQGGLPVFIAEWGSVTFAGSAAQATFIAQMQGYVTANHEIAAVMYCVGLARKVSEPSRQERATIGSAPVRNPGPFVSIASRKAV